MSRIGIASILITLVCMTGVLVLLAILPPIPHRCAAQDVYSERWSGRLGWFGLLPLVSFLLGFAALFVRRQRRLLIAGIGMIFAVFAAGLWLFAELDVLGTACGVMWMSGHGGGHKRIRTYRRGRLLLRIAGIVLICLGTIAILFSGLLLINYDPALAEPGTKIHVAAVIGLALSLAAVAYPLFMSATGSALLNRTISGPTITRYGAGMPFQINAPIRACRHEQPGPVVHYRALGHLFKHMAAQSPDLEPVVL